MVQMAWKGVRLESLAEVVGTNEGGEVIPQLSVCLVMVAADGRFLKRPVYSFDLAVIRHDGFGALTSR